MRVGWSVLWFGDWTSIGWLDSDSLDGLRLNGLNWLDGINWLDGLNRLDGLDGLDGRYLDGLNGLDGLGGLNGRYLNRLNRLNWLDSLDGDGGRGRRRALLRRRSWAGGAQGLG